MKNAMKLPHLLTKTSGLLGIDISNTAVKLVELTYNQNSYYLTSCAHVKLPNQVLNEKLRDNAIIKALQQARKISETSTISAAIAISDLNVLCKTIEVDATLTQQEIIIYLRQHAQQHFNLQPQELLIDFEILTTNKTNSGLMQIKWAAALRRDIEPKINLLKAAGLDTKIIDIESHAVARALIPTLKNTMNNNIGIIYIGQSNLILMILHNSHLIYSKAESHEIPVTCSSESNTTKEILFSIITRLLRLSPISTLQPSITHFLLAGDFISFELIETLQLQSNIIMRLANPFTTINTTALSNHITQIPTYEFIASIGLARRENR